VSCACVTNEPATRISVQMIYRNLFVIVVGLYGM
jgi:hypothetical protein